MLFLHRNDSYKQFLIVLVGSVCIHSSMGSNRGLEGLCCFLLLHAACTAYCVITLIGILPGPHVPFVLRPLNNHHSSRPSTSHVLKLKLPSLTKYSLIQSEIPSFLPLHLHPCCSPNTIHYSKSLSCHFMHTGCQPSKHNSSQHPYRNTAFLQHSIHHSMPTTAFIPQPSFPKHP